ncbi:MAG: hypothetical protein AMXMBFR58_03690 [Phycisphaerae bacterium]
MPAVSATIPERIGEIELVRELGRGGMGVVWLGRDTLLGRQVAVKFLLHADASPEGPGFSAFVEGAKLAASIRSKRLIEIYRAGVQGQQAYLVMEYSPGRPLSELIARKDRWTRSAAIATMGEVCSAIAELHEQGIVHGDIKPSNILIESDGRVVVTDFGLTLSLPREWVGAARALGGTPRYMAPEVFSGMASYQSDVYALGIMFFEALCGSPPFDGDVTELESQHRSEALPWERMIPPVDGALREIIERATHREVRLRSKSARHMLDALRRAQPDAAAWANGHRQVIEAAHRGGATDDSKPHVSSRYGSSYYEAIEGLARQRVVLAGAPPAASEGEAVSQVGPLPGLRGDDVLDVSLPCVACDYDLRGLPVGASCPECTTPIPVSADLSRLCLANPAWMKRLLIGMNGVVALPTILLVPGLITILPLPMDPRVARLLVPIALAAMGLFSASAVFRATTRDPATLRDSSAANKDPKTRWLARQCLVSATLLMVLGNMFSGSRLAGPVLLNLGIVIAATGAVCWLLWTQDLRRRGWSASDGDAIATAEPRRRRVMRNRLWRQPIITLVLFVVPVALVMLLATTGKQSMYSWDFVQELLLALLAAAGLSLLVAGYLQALILIRILKREKRPDAAEVAAQITRALAASASHPTPSDTGSPSPRAPTG